MRAGKASRKERKGKSNYRGVNMPIVTIDGPKIDKEKKRNLVQQVTQVVAKIYELPEDAITTVIKENPPENIGVGGKLIADRHSK